MRHLDYPEGTAPSDLGDAALDDLLDRGDLDAWKPLARAVRADPNSDLAERVLRLCDAHHMYGTSSLWRTWIARLRGVSLDASSLAEIRRSRGLSQDAVGRRLGISQSDVSKLERRRDVRLSTLRAYVAATGGQLELTASYPDEQRRIDI